MKLLVKLLIIEWTRGQMECGGWSEAGQGPPIKTILKKKKTYSKTIQRQVGQAHTRPATNRNETLKEGGREG